MPDESPNMQPAGAGVPAIPSPMPRWYCRCEAVITDSGSKSGQTPVREPVATLGAILAQDDEVKGSRTRHDGRKMPMGWNIGQVIPVGTRGIAEYIKQGSVASLWRFTPYPEQSDAVEPVDHRKANYAMAYLLWLARRPGHDEQPHRREFELTEDEALAIRQLIIDAVEQA